MTTTSEHPTVSHAAHKDSHGEHEHVPLDTTHKHNHAPASSPHEHHHENGGHEYEHGGHGGHEGHGHEHGHGHGEHGEGLDGFIDTFMHLAVEFTLIFLGMSILIAFVFAYIPKEKIQKLFRLPYGGGHIVAIFFAALTPLCTFSTVPMLQGLLRTNTKFGPSMTFLFCSPLLSPIILSLLFTAFGGTFTVIYTSLVALLALSMGTLLELAHFEKYLIPSHALDNIQYTCCPHADHAHHAHQAHQAHKDQKMQKPSLRSALKTALKSGFTNFKLAFPYLLMGILLGALAYSYAPQEFLQKYAHKNTFTTIPLAALVGLPLHVHIETLIPASKALLENGVGLGVVMAFFIGSGGVSITGLMVLKTIFKMPLLIAMTLCVFGMAVFMGLTFPFIYS